MTTLQRPRLVLVAVVSVAVLALYLASPFLMLWRLQRAAERNDEATIELLIDFPAVRAALKEEASNTLRDKLGGVIPNNLVAGVLGGDIGSEAMNRTIDSLATPAGAAQMIKGANIESASFGGVTRFNFKARGLRASAKFNGFGWRVVRIGLPGS